MFDYYSRAEVCYVYLADVELAGAELNDFSPPRQDAPDEGRLAVQHRSNLRDCRWFTRGWTLQELLAPRKSVFYDRD